MADDLLSSMHARGLLADASSLESLRGHLDSGSRTLYCGFDPTADSLHAGNLVPLLALRRFQLAGHRPILLVGGATGMIGDPGGRSAERELNPAELVDAYAEKIARQAAPFLDFDANNGAILVNNAEWTRNLDVISFLRDIGKHFSVNAMLQKESIRRRVQDESLGISYTEFSYLVLQAYDFMVLNDRYGCTIQLGGSDQWGNITSGIDLVRRMRGEHAYAVTFPLVCKSDGTKFGKSSGGAIWLDPLRTSPYAFYQFWLNSADDDILPYLRLFTFLDESELEEVAEIHTLEPGKRAGHRRLAREVTELVHGSAGVSAAERITVALFSNQLADLTESDLGQLALDGLPCHKVQLAELPLTRALADLKLAVTPRGEVTLGQARKLIQGNSVSVNGRKVTDVDLQLSRESALYGRFHLLQKGKKHHAVLDWSDVQ